jgi:hypothetical protein
MKFRLYLIAMFILLSAGSPMPSPPRTRLRWPSALPSSQSEGADFHRDSRPHRPQATLFYERRDGQANRSNPVP